MLTDTGRELIEKFDNGSLTDSEKIDLFNLMTYFSVSGTGASDKDSLKYLSQFTTNINRQNVSRNEGLLAITEKDQEKTLGWSEGTLVSCVSNGPLNGQLDGLLEYISSDPRIMPALESYSDQ